VKTLAKTTVQLYHPIEATSLKYDMAAIRSRIDARWRGTCDGLDNTARQGCKYTSLICFMLTTSDKYLRTVATCMDLRLFCGWLDLEDRSLNVSKKKRITFVGIQTKNDQKVNACNIRILKRY
jgi:hypothetical protein